VRRVPVRLHTWPRGSSRKTLHSLYMAYVWSDARLTPL
jgi:hypothetical protein